MDEAATNQTPTDRLKLTAEAFLAGGQSESAAKAYAELWERTHDQEVGAGLLDCLGLLGRDAEALPIADELGDKYPDSPVCRKQVHTAWYRGRFLRRDPDSPLDKLEACAESLIRARLIAEWPLVVLAVMEEAALAREWDKVKDWAARTQPAMFSEAPRKDRDTELESPRTAWYDCLLQALLGTRRAATALDLLDSMPVQPPAQRDRFLLHRLNAYLLLDSPYDAVAVYAEFGQRRPPPRWAFIESSRLLRDTGDLDDAVVHLCRALLYCGTVDQSGATLIDLSELMLRLGWKETALEHLQHTLRLFRAKGWFVPRKMYALLAEAEAGSDDPGKDSIHDPKALSRIYEVWHREATRRLRLRRDLKHARRVRHNLRGTLEQGPEGWTVRVSGELECPCALSELPAWTDAGSAVTFDAVPGFDRTRRIEIRRATNVRPA